MTDGMDRDGMDQDHADRTNRDRRDERNRVDDHDGRRLPDNSARNPANPDSTRDVPWGQQSWDEMLFGSVRYRVVEADAAVSMAGGQD